MPKITLSIPDELLAKFKKEFPEVNVAELARRIMIQKVEELKKLTYFVALISLAIFSVLSGIKNLKDICENTNSKN